MLPYKFRRSLSIGIPILTASLLLGVISGIFGIKIEDNILSSGITLKFVFAILNGILAWMIWKNRT